MKIQTDFGKTTSGSILSSFMNNFFKEKVEKLKAKTSPDLTRDLSYTERFRRSRGYSEEVTGFFYFKSVARETIMYNIKQLTNTSSVGIDDIGTEVVKKFKNCLSPAIQHIVNLCLTKSIYPDQWKCGIVSPIPKKGNLSLPSNWRPIVLNCVLSKILERCMNDQMMAFISNNILDSPSQHAYRKSKSCLSAWTELDTFIAEQRNAGRVVGVCLTDQSAAFNVLQPDILCGKLKILGFSKSAINLILHYLTGRKTKCFVNGVMSSTVDLTSGVGEGSVLGPTLYTLGQVCVGVVCDILIDKMHEDHGIAVDSLSVEFADDVTGAIGAANEHDLQIAVNLMMDIYQDYFSSCGLCLNADKCAVLVLRSKPKLQTIMWNGKEEEQKVKLLGLWLDNRYDFADHVNYLIQCCSFKISCLRKVAPWLTDENLKLVVDSLVISQITYCAEIYLRLLKTRNKIQKLINIAARLCLRVNRYSNCERNMEQLGWLNADNLYRSLLVCSLRRFLRTEAPERTMRNINNEARAGIRLRIIHVKWIKYGKDKKEFAKKSWLIMAVKTWNELAIGKERFDDDKAFKEWVHVKTISLHGNPNQ